MKKNESRVEIHTLVGAGEEPSFFVTCPGDFLMAADAGLSFFEKIGLKPDLAIGDFDSLGNEPQDIPVLRYPVRKDETDMFLAVTEGLRRGYGVFYLYGALGGRFDHSIANIQTLTFLAEKDAVGVLMGNRQSVAVLRNGSLSFSSEGRGNISVFSVGGLSSGVSIRGLSYTAENVELAPDFPLGVSNSFLPGEAVISVENGMLCLIWDNENGDNLLLTEKPYFPSISSGE